MVATARKVYVAFVQPNADLNAKINSKHGVTWDEMEEVVLAPARPLRVRWIYPTEDDPRGRRVVIEGRTAAGRILRVLLYPVDEQAGEWRLATAVPLP